jgi:hypothetical protein
VWEAVDSTGESPRPGSMRALADSQESTPTGPSRGKRRAADGEGLRGGKHAPAALVEQVETAIVKPEHPSHSYEGSRDSPPGPRTSSSKAQSKSRSKRAKSGAQGSAGSLPGGTTSGDRGPLWPLGPDLCLKLNGFLTRRRLEEPGFDDRLENSVMLEELAADLRRGGAREALDTACDLSDFICRSAHPFPPTPHGPVWRYVAAFLGLPYHEPLPSPPSTPSDPPAAAAGEGSVPSEQGVRTKRARPQDRSREAVWRAVRSLGVSAKRAIHAGREHEPPLTGLVDYIEDFTRWVGRGTKPSPTSHVSSAFNHMGGEGRCGRVMHWAPTVLCVQALGGASAGVDGGPPDPPSWRGGGVAPTQWVSTTGLSCDLWEHGTPR